MHCWGVCKDVSSGFNLFSFNGHSSSFSVTVHFNVLYIDMVKKNMIDLSFHPKWTIFVKARNWSKSLPLTSGNKAMNRAVSTVYIHITSELSAATSNLLDENLSSTDLLTRFKPCLLPISLEWVIYHFIIFLIFRKEQVPASYPSEESHQTTCRKIPDERWPPSVMLAAILVFSSV